MKDDTKVQCSRTEFPEFKFATSLSTESTQGYVEQLIAFAYS
jgi:hypothetical protein